jgi:hypothetical protein
LRLCTIIRGQAKILPRVSPQTCPHRPFGVAQATECFVDFLDRLAVKLDDGLGRQQVDDQMLKDIGISIGGDRLPSSTIRARRSSSPGAWRFAQALDRYPSPLSRSILGPAPRRTSAGSARSANGRTHRRGTGFTARSFSAAGCGQLALGHSAADASSDAKRTWPALNLRRRRGDRE